MVLWLWVQIPWLHDCRFTHMCHLVAVVGTVLQGDESAIEIKMGPITNVAICIIELYDSMIANKGPHDPNPYMYTCILLY